MKKSWHPLLQVNQERVWKREQEASEERKKLEELRREREQEREMQELQRLQEEAGGKKRVDKVDWMYATPASNSGPSSTEMEDFLLGKKRVDKLLRADDTPAVSRSDQTSFISLQNANNSRDLAAKVREDPMLAIKQQEQAAYEALLRDPARLRQMKRKAGIDTESVTETKEERRRRKEARRRRHDDAHHRHHRSRTNDGDALRKDDQDVGADRSKDHDQGRTHRKESHHDTSHSYGKISSRERAGRSSRQHGEARSSHNHSPRRSHDDYEDRHRNTARTEDRSPRRTARTEDRSPRRGPSPSNPEVPRRGAGSFRHTADDEQRKREEREAKLREMTQNAASMHEERTSYVSRINSEEAEQERHEAELRQKLIVSRQKGHSDGRGDFILGQQRKAFGDNVDLADRIKRGRGYQSFES